MPEGLASLQHLDLRGNQLPSLSLPEGLTSLKELWIENNRLASLTLPDGLTNLERLELRTNQLTSLILPDGLTNLQSLHLRENQMTSLILPDGLTSLRSLQLQNNQLTNLVVSPGASSQWGGNLSLYVYGNPFMEIGLPVGFSEPTRFDVTRWVGERERYRISYYDPLSVAPSSPKISISRGENGLEVSWESGVLQKSAGVEGPWQNVDETSPLRIFPRPSLPAEFFRVRAE